MVNELSNNDPSISGAVFLQIKQLVFGSLVNRGNSGINGDSLLFFH